MQRCVDYLNRANSIIGWNSTSWPWRIARNARARHSPLTVEMECHRPLFRRTPVRTFPQPIGLPFRDRSALLVDKADTLNDEPAERPRRVQILATAPVSDLQSGLAPGCTRPSVSRPGWDGVARGQRSYGGPFAAVIMIASWVFISGAVSLELPGCTARNRRSNECSAEPACMARQRRNRTLRDAETSYLISSCPRLIKQSKLLAARCNAAGTAEWRLFRKAFGCPKSLLPKFI